MFGSFGWFELLLLLMPFFVWGIVKILRSSKKHNVPTGDSGEKPLADARKFSSIFISYRRNDSSDITGRIYDCLAQQFGKNTLFRDVDSIPLGLDFRKHLAESVGQCQLLLAIIGKGWLDTDQSRLDDRRDYVRIEIESAFQRNIPIIPVLVQGATVPNEDDLPNSMKALAYHNSISIRPDPDFHHDMTRLIQGIQVHLSVAPPRVSQK